MMFFTNAVKFSSFCASPLDALKVVKVVVSVSQLLQLVPNVCPLDKCSKTVVVNQTYVGATLLLTITCTAHHNFTRCSSPRHYDQANIPLYLRFTACIPPLHSLYTSASQLVYLRFTACIPPLHSLYTSTSQLVYLRFAACIPSLRSLYTSASQLVYLRFTACIPPLHSLYTSASQLVYPHFTACIPPLRSLYTSASLLVYLRFTACMGVCYDVDVGVVGKTKNHDQDDILYNFNSLQCIYFSQ